MMNKWSKSRSYTRMNSTNEVHFLTSFQLDYSFDLASAGSAVKKFEDKSVIFGLSLTEFRTFGPRISKLSYNKTKCRSCKLLTL